jgi:hypothetical protein
MASDNPMGMIYAHRLAAKDDKERAKWSCTCPRCPTYKGTGETADNFCGQGKSVRITKEKGCICQRCVVSVQAGNKDVYCCTRGTKTLNMLEGLMKGLKT